MFKLHFVDNQYFEISVIRLSLKFIIIDGLNFKY